MSSKLKAESLPAEEVRSFSRYPKEPMMVGHPGRRREGTGISGVPPIPGSYYQIGVFRMAVHYPYHESGGIIKPFKAMHRIKSRRYAIYTNSAVEL